MIDRDTGFVIRRYNFRETSLIATLYTRSHGKIKGVFKAFHTPKKEFTTSLDIFTLNEFVFYPKKSELWLVSFADMVKDYPYLRKSYSKNIVASLFISIIDRIMPMWDVNVDVFNLLSDSLELLKSEDELKVMVIFLVELLTISGFEPQFSNCLRCHGPMRERVLFSVSRGGLLCAKCAQGILDAQTLNADVVLSIRYIQDVDFLKGMRLRLSNACERGIFYILREFVLYHLEIDIQPALSLYQKNIN
jgi:DNA repair protein RecO (recombination protein O)